MYPSHTSATTRPDVTIRAAHDADRAALEAIAAQIWDGDDYLPRVLDDWFSDPHGGFYVATIGEQVVGVTKLTRYAPGEWWMEGLRVDPAYQGLGLGRILHHFVVNQVRQHGDGEVRFSTGSMNEAVQQLARETGFQQKAVYVPYGADVLDAPVERIALLGPDDQAGVRAFLDGSVHYERGQRSLEWDWSFYRLTDERLRERLAAGLVYGWRNESGALCGVVIFNPTDKDRWPGEPTLKIAYLDVPEGELSDAARDIRRLAAQLERSRVRIKAFKDAARLAALEDAGFVREWEGEVLLFARDVVLTGHADVRIDSVDSTPTNN